MIASLFIILERLGTLHLTQEFWLPGFGDTDPAGFPLTVTSAEPEIKAVRVAEEAKGTGARAGQTGEDSGISCRSGTTWRSRGSSTARSAITGNESFGVLESYKKLEVLGEGSYATVYRGFSQ